MPPMLLLHLVAGCASPPGPTDPGAPGDGAGAPAWAASRLLHRAPIGVGDVVVDGERAYLPVGGNRKAAETGENEIVAIPLSGGKPRVLAEAGAEIPGDALAIDEEYLYWSSSRGISRVPLEGGESELIVPAAEAGPAPAELVVDRDQLFWIEWTGEGGPPRPLRGAPKTGGKAVALTPPVHGANGLCVDGDTVYYTTPDGVHRVPREGGTPTRQGNAPTDATIRLVQDRDALYTIRVDGARLVRIPKNGTPTVQLATGALYTSELAVDASYVYFVDRAPDGGWRLRRVAKEGGREPETVDTGPQDAFVRHLAVGPGGPVFAGRSSVWALRKQD